MTSARLKDRACPDCPARSARMLEVLVDQPSGCAMRCMPIEARQPLPIRWRGEFTIALVRRGIVVRQRVDRSGRVAAIDIAGPSSAIPIAPLADDGATGYAVDDVMLCLASEETLALLDAQRRDGEDNGGFAMHDLVRAQTSMRDRVERIAEARARASATSRVACLLLAIVDNLSPALRLSTVPASIQQRDLAALVALRHESVCRSLAALESQGIVVRTPGGLEILDRRRLETI